MHIKLLPSQLMTEKRSHSPLNTAESFESKRIRESIRFVINEVEGRAQNYNGIKPSS